MLVKIEDLDVGDEILIPCQSDFKRLRVERKPQERDASKQTYYYNYRWKTVKCAIRNNNRGTNSSNYDCTSDEYNDTVYQDLNGRRIWLIKKGNIL